MRSFHPYPNHSRDDQLRKEDPVPALMNDFGSVAFGPFLTAKAWICAAGHILNSPDKIKKDCF
jgi:hypothetical protein